MTKQTYPPRIMYIEYKGGGFREDQFGNVVLGASSGLHGSARIGRVTFSRTGATLHYRGQSFQSLKVYGFKANYFDVESGEQYWISGPRRDGADRLYKSNWPVEIDDDVREEYWTEIRNRPELKDRTEASLSTVNRPNTTKLARDSGLPRKAIVRGATNGN